MPGRGRSRRPMPDEEGREPWERRHDESWQAWQAFRAFRDLGAGGKDRTVAEAYRTVHPGRKQANAHYWGDWAKQYDWDGRALAYDRHLDRVRQQAVVVATQAEGEKWVRRQYEDREQIYDSGQRLLQRVAVVSRMPPVRQTNRDHATGAVTIFEALPLGEARVAASILKDLLVVLGGVTADGVRNAEALKGTPDDPADQKKLLEQAQRELDEWQQRMIRDVSNTPSVLAIPGTSSTPPA